LNGGSPLFILIITHTLPPAWCGGIGIGSSGNRLCDVYPPSSSLLDGWWCHIHFLKGTTE